VERVAPKLGNAPFSLTNTSSSELIISLLVITGI